MKRKALSILFAVMLLVTALSLSAFAENEAVAKIGDTEYATLEEAIAAVPADGTETTVTLLSDAEGNGIIVKAGQNVVIDFGGFTYSVEGKTVGSVGTETLAFQLLKGSDVTLKNGTLTSTKAKMLVQNYSDLTLEDITLDGTKSEACLYTLSNNFGDTVIDGNTNIFGDEDTVAFDLWYGESAIYDEGLSVSFVRTFSGIVEGTVEYGAKSRVTTENWQEKVRLYIDGGCMDVNFVATSDTIEEANIVIAGGVFPTPVNPLFCEEGYEPVTYDEDAYGVALISDHAQIGDTKYHTLEAAVAAAPADGTETVIKLLSDETGNGIVVKAGQNIVIDFGGNTYFADGKTVGSAGTQTLAFQLLMGSKVTLKNGTLSTTKAKMLVQNYSDLTLEDIILDGTKSKVNQYTLSNNFGNTVIKGQTEILGDENTVAFDLWYGESILYFDGLSVTFDETFTGKVEGTVEYGAHSRVTAENWQKKVLLVIKSGDFDIEFVATSDTLEEANIEISGGKFTAPLKQEFCTKGYKATSFADGKYGVCKHGVQRVVESKEKTCDTDGYDKIKCTACEFTVTIPYATTGHSFTIYTSDNNATYFADGTKTAICNYGCGATHTVKNNGSKLVLGKTSSITATQTVNSISLKWKAVKGATVYKVYIYKNGWVNYGSTLNPEYITLKDLTPGTVYRFAVKAGVKSSDGTTVWAPTYSQITTCTKPEAPKTVKASDTTTKTTTLTWSKCTGATKYRVYRKTSSGWKTIATVEALSYNVKAMKAGTSYTFAVKPCITSGSTDVWASGYTAVTIKTPLLDAPVLRVASTAKGRLTAAWADVSGESGYQIFYSTSKSGSYKRLANYKADTTKVYETDLESGKTYYFMARAYTKVDGKYVYSNYSEVKSIKIK
ncbi:MAG: fibronectin type III domain-containing protein [Clostridia bacterium]|nr:fibronectin type III domain-containing protein [Clostridia bacterium]